MAPPQQQCIATLNLQPPPHANIHNHEPLQVMASIHLATEQHGFHRCSCSGKWKHEAEHQMRSPVATNMERSSDDTRLNVEGDKVSGSGAMSM